MSLNLVWPIETMCSSSASMPIRGYKPVVAAMEYVIREINVCSKITSPSKWKREFGVFTGARNQAGRK